MVAFPVLSQDLGRHESYTAGACPSSLDAAGLLGSVETIAGGLKPVLSSSI